METNGLLQVLNNINILTPQIKSQLESYLVEDHYAKKSILLKAGQVSQRIYFVKQGFTRAYYHKGESEFTSWFMGKGEIIVSVYSFFSRKPSFENIQVLEDSILQSINWDQLQSIYKNHPEFNLTGRLITEQYYIRSEERVINLQTLTAKQRYENLLSSYPDILQKASLGQIASFLSIKQETLSRIRAKG
ncbi:Crp/Fnr family transcriptional regulator [Mucilaginibacter ginsenosidivorax]|uniref:Crp/Fnr family transcriptional regulator n=1 Tax=Mucilaginibacter ginsenosidivorax TaxID=862126 RepID=A0A5B8W4U0_9SPHI|nr:Crp/Fnr family transcriptional regulator [Mucilaginibacter ginsenosidivorax]QEC77358.1 Crp/Fnr family transcriptional regulator [Mucilaginibacter ginsenosidivorax]